MPLGLSVGLGTRPDGSGSVDSWSEEVETYPSFLTILRRQSNMPLYASSPVAVAVCS